MTKLIEKHPAWAAVLVFLGTNYENGYRIKEALIEAAPPLT